MAALDTLYRTVMKRNSTYLAFVLCGAFLGEKALSGTVDALWEKNNRGKLYKHLEGGVIGGPKEEDE
eukprot:jgi/Pico_ML_1/54939/g76.t1